MIIHPVCGAPLGRSVKILSLISILFTLIVVCLEIYLIAIYGMTVTESNDIDEEVPASRLLSNETNTMNIDNKNPIVRLFSIGPNDFRYVVGFWFISWALDICLSILLFVGAVKKNETFCLLWFYIRCALLFFRLIFLIMYILAGITLIRKVPVIILFIFRLYCLWVVSKFIKEIQLEKTGNPDGFSVSLDNKLDNTKKLKTNSYPFDSNTNNPSGSYFT